MRYAAFLRGINVGGHKQIRMDALREAFAAWGFGDIRTLLASGNVLFEAGDEGEKVLAETISQNIEEKFGFPVSVIVRRLKELQRLVEQNPFDGVAVTKDTRLYVTLLPEKRETSLSIPYETPEKDFAILRVSDKEVCSVLTLNMGRGTVDAMAVLEKEFGKDVTTRNWNTILKVVGK
jgi:uncharacterized protein (DUF1697 family)